MEILLASFVVGGILTFLNWRILKETIIIRKETIIIRKESVKVRKLLGEPPDDSSP